MNSKEKLGEILALVDTDKIDLPSFNISVKKYNQIAEIYTRIMFYTSLITAGNEKMGDAEELKETSFSVIDKIVDNPNYCTYEERIKRIRTSIENSPTIKMYATHFDDLKMRSIKNDSIKKSMNESLKNMCLTLKTIYDIYNEEEIAVFFDVELYEKRLYALSLAKKADVQMDIESDNECQIKEDETVDDNSVESNECKNNAKVGKKTTLFGRIKKFFTK